MTTILKTIGSAVLAVAIVAVLAAMVAAYSAAFACVALWRRATVKAWFVAYAAAVAALVVALVLCGCSRSPARKSGWLFSETAMSNATRFAAPPAGYRLMCDGDGHYCPRSKSGTVFDLAIYVVTNREDAMVACWRLKEVLEAPLVADRIDAQWQDCERLEAQR